MDLGILRTIGIILFVYLTWRNLRDNYSENEVVTYSWSALLTFFVVGRLAFGLVNFGVWNDSWISWFSVWDKPGMEYISGFFGVVLVSFLFCHYNNWKFLPFCEDSLKNILVFLAFLMGDELLRTRFNLQVGSYLLLLVVMIFVLRFLEKKYRSFVWYKSGKKGFAFLMTVFLFFLALGIVNFTFKLNLIYSIVYWVISLISLVRLFILGGIYERNKR